MRNLKKRQMKLNRSVFLIFVLIGMSFFIYHQNLNQKNNTENQVAIGVSDDMSGFVVDYMIHNEIYTDGEVKPFFIRDC